MPKTIFSHPELLMQHFPTRLVRPLHLELLFMLWSQMHETTPWGFSSAETQPDLLLADYQLHAEPCFSLQACLSGRHFPDESIGSSRARRQ